MPDGLDHIILRPRLPPSAGSWWLDVPRDHWRSAYEAQQARLASVTLRATGPDVPSTHQTRPRPRRVL